MSALLTTQNMQMTLSPGCHSHAVNFCLEPGDCLGILGNNGTGKTTFLLGLAGLKKSYKGSVLLANQDISSLKHKTRAQRLGVLFQDSIPAFSQSVYAYCLAARYCHQAYWLPASSSDHSAVQTALATVGLITKQTLPIQYLSGGEYRRLALAALLVQDPHIFLLDEPTNHLDISYQYKILGYCHSLTRTRGKAIVMTLHDINLAQRFCNKILLCYPNGEFRFSAADVGLTAKNLSALYAHPIAAITTSQGKHWLPVHDVL